MVTIAGYGGYVPLYRIDRTDVAEQHGGRASGETAVPARDENHVTMASEAAETALARADIDGADLTAVYSASVTDPFAEHGVAAHVAYRVGATGDVRTGDFRASPRAATDALLAARDRVETRGGPALVVAADVMPVEPGHDDEAYSGAAAGAVVLSEDADDPAATVEGVGQETTGFVERHRLHGEPAVAGDQKYEGEYGFGEAVDAAATRALSDAGGTPDSAVVAVPNQRMASGALEEFPDVEHVSTFDAVGYAGTATLFLDLTHLLEGANAGETGLALAYGAGGADAVAFAVEDDTAGEGLTVAQQLDTKEYVTYAKHLEYRERVDYRGVISP